MEGDIMGAWRFGKIQTIGDYRAMVLQTLCDLSDEYAAQGMEDERRAMQKALKEIHTLNFNTEGALVD